MLKLFSSFLCFSFIFSPKMFLDYDLQTSDMSAKKIVENVTKRYQTITDVSAHFEQTFFWKLAGEQQTIEGKIYVKDGKKYRIETDDQLIVTDGLTIWTLSKTNKQVLVDALNENSQQNPLMREFLTRYSEEYIPKLVDQKEIKGAEYYLVELSAKSEDMFITKVGIWVDEKTWLMLSVEQTDINGNLTKYIVTDVDFNTKLSETLFKIEVPEGYELIDLR